MSPKCCTNVGVGGLNQWLWHEIRLFSRCNQNIYDFGVELQILMSVWEPLTVRITIKMVLNLKLWMVWVIECNNELVYGRGERERETVRERYRECVRGKGSVCTLEWVLFVVPKRISFATLACWLILVVAAVVMSATAVDFPSLLSLLLLKCHLN